VHQSARDGRPLQQAARQGADRLTGPVGEAHPREHGVGAFLADRPGHVVHRRPEDDVLAYRVVAVEVRRVADPPHCPAPALQDDVPPVRVDQPREHPQQGRLPRPVRPEDRQGLARLEREGDVVEGPDPPEGVSQSLSSQHRCERPGR
jgi:hypothetical protein